MKLILVAAIVWIRSDFGGRSNEPVIGLRPSIRFQKYVSDWMMVARDVEIIDLDIDTNTWSGIVKMKFTRNVSPREEWLKKGELIELLDAYRVIAVGKIIEITTQ
jgi:hypothetical protein